MGKLISQVTITETDDGFTVDVKGRKFEDLCSCGCMPCLCMCSCGCRSSRDDADCCKPSN